MDVKVLAEWHHEDPVPPFQIAVPPGRDLVFVCIGSDTVTGECFAPMVGSALIQMGVPYVYGDLHNPVHARNLGDIIDVIHRVHEKPYIVALDAGFCGTEGLLGSILVKSGALRPGLGAGKYLPEIGDLHIIGLVCETNDFDNLTACFKHRLLSMVSLGLVTDLATSTVDFLKNAIPKEVFIPTCV